MKKNCIVNNNHPATAATNFVICHPSSVICLLFSILLFSCTSRTKPGQDSRLPALHTKPANQEVIASVPVIRADSGTRILTAILQGRVTYDARDQAVIASRIGGRIERLYIRYNYQPVQKGELILEIYSPDLVAAQRELIFIHATGSDAALLQRARQRLLLLGMREQQVNQVLQTGNPFYRLPVYSPVAGYITEQPVAAKPANTGMVTSSAPATGMGSMGEAAAATASAAEPTTTPVLLQEGAYVNAGQRLFSIYGNNNLVAEFAFPAAYSVRPLKEQQLVFHRTGDDRKTFTGAVGMVVPVLQNGQPFTQARIYLHEPSLRPGQLLTGYMPVVLEKGWWLPAAATWQTGNKVIVFRRQNGAFVPEKVNVGAMLNGMVQVLDSIGDWELAGQAAYLVDSESFVQ